MMRLWRPSENRPGTTLIRPTVSLKCPRCRPRTGASVWWVGKGRHGPHRPRNRRDIRARTRHWHLIGRCATCGTTVTLT